MNPGEKPQIHCYCETTEILPSMLTCGGCKLRFHMKCVLSPNPTTLEGDTLFSFTCKNCSGTNLEILKRKSISWMQTVHLALYNLHMTSSGKCGYFKWKEQICAFIEKHWSLLFGFSRKKTSSWQSTIAGTLSTGCPSIFKSGIQDLKEAGWWSLKEIEPPNPSGPDFKYKLQKSHNPRSRPENTTETPRSCRRRTSLPMQAAIELKERRAMTQEAKDIRRKQSQANQSSSDNKEALRSHLLQSETYISPKVSSPSTSRSSSAFTPPPEPTVKKEVLYDLTDLVATETVPALLMADDFDLADTCSIDSDMEVDPCTLTPNGSPINIDSTLDVSEILSSVAHSPESSFMSKQDILQDEDSNLFSSSLNSSAVSISSFDCSTRHAEDESSKAHGYGENCDEEPGSESESELPPAKRQKREEEGTDEEKEEPKLQLISLYEEKQLLKKLNNMAEEATPLDPKVNRLRRKLIVRQIKRERGMPVFDIDSCMCNLVTDQPVTQETGTLNKHGLPTTRLKHSDSRILDRFQSSHNTRVNTSRHHIAFLNRLVGFDENQITAITSPYTARILKPFIRRDYESSPLKIKLLQEIIAYPHRDDPNWLPPDVPPIDYCYVRPEHIPSVNMLAREFFWPAIDLSECLQYPDFSCVVLYRKIVIGFAFLVPDVSHNEAYISFIFVHPEWRNAGVASFMLYHLIQTCMGKDITLHVSATNPAMLLYQKFGFKPEEFILDFYDKYYSLDSKETRHAFFLRLRR